MLLYSVWSFLSEGEKKDSEERSKVYHSRVNMLFDEVVYLICIVVVMLNVYCEA